MPWDLKGWTSLGLRFVSGFSTDYRILCSLAVSWGQMDGCAGAFSGKTGPDVEMRKREL